MNLSGKFCKLFMDGSRSLNLYECLLWKSRFVETDVVVKIQVVVRIGVVRVCFLVACSARGESKKLFIAKCAGKHNQRR